MQQILDFLKGLWAKIVAWWNETAWPWLNAFLQEAWKRIQKAWNDLFGPEA